jgi:hypothetical protein
VLSNTSRPLSVNLPIHSACRVIWYKKNESTPMPAKAGVDEVYQIYAVREKEKEKREKKVRFWYPMPGPILFYATPVIKQLFGQGNSLCGTQPGGSRQCKDGTLECAGTPKTGVLGVLRNRRGADY